MPRRHVAQKTGNHDANNIIVMGVPAYCDKQDVLGVAWRGRDVNSTPVGSWAMARLGYPNGVCARVSESGAGGALLVAVLMVS